MNPTERRQARHYALQAMYQWQLTGATSQEIEEQFLFTQIKKKTDLAYFKELINGAITQQEKLDEVFLPFLKRPIAELDPVELSILRLATYEFVNRLDIPYRVAINEALELAKKFGSIEGYKFVNGVLDQVARKVRHIEVAADAKKKNG
jgi:N utilization substance protein B